MKPLFGTGQPGSGLVALLLERFLVDLLNGLREVENRFHLRISLP